MFDSYGYLNASTGEFGGLVRDLKDEKSHIGGKFTITFSINTKNLKHSRNVQNKIVCFRNRILHLFGSAKSY